jgi:Ca2+-binding EF-hand superfamily protein
LRLGSNIEKEESETWLMEVFQIIDQDCDGRLSKAELLNIVDLYQLDITEK